MVCVCLLRSIDSHLPWLYPKEPDCIARGSLFCHHELILRMKKSVHALALLHYFGVKLHERQGFMPEAAFEKLAA